jgi:hypothetical protein
VSKTHVDLRCGRRLTVNEAKIILEALDHVGVNMPKLRAKLTEAIMLATHTCAKAPGSVACAVCGEVPENTARVTAMRSKRFRETLATSAADNRKEEARQKEIALRTKPSLRLAKEPQ